MERISVSHLSAGYGRDIILKDVDLCVSSGEIRVILGGSGCGKSTLLMNIIGLETPIKGEITILGEPINYRTEGYPEDLRKKIGVLFQNSALISSMTVAANVSLPLKVHNPRLPDSVVREIVMLKLSQVQLEHAYHKYPAELSGGMKKRAALARAIVTDPLILFCDEPSAGLDPLTSKSLDDLLLQLRDRLGFSIVVVTHELDSIRTICDKLTFLEDGLVIFDGTLQEALSSGPDSVKNFFKRKKDGNESEAANLIPFNLEG